MLAARAVSSAHPRAGRLHAARLPTSVCGRARARMCGDVTLTFTPAPDYPHPPLPLSTPNPSFFPALSARSLYLHDISGGGHCLQGPGRRPAALPPLRCPAPPHPLPPASVARRPAAGPGAAARCSTRPLWMWRCRTLTLAAPAARVRCRTRGRVRSRAPAARVQRVRCRTLSVDLCPAPPGSPGPRAPQCIRGPVAGGRTLVRCAGAARGRCCPCFGLRAAQYPSRGEGGRETSSGKGWARDEGVGGREKGR